MCQCDNLSENSEGRVEEVNDMSSAVQSVGDPAQFVVTKSLLISEKPQQAHVVSQ